MWSPQDFDFKPGTRQWRNRVADSPGPSELERTQGIAVKLLSSASNSSVVKLAVVVLALWTWASTGLFGQSQSDALRYEQAPLMTLDEAVNLALDNNRLVKNSSLEAEKFDFRVNTATSRRLPQFQFAVLGGELLRPVYFKFPAGAFGTYPATGPIPATNTSIKSPAVFTTYTTAGITQPLSQ